MDLGWADSSICDRRMNSWSPRVKVGTAGSVSPRDALVSGLVLNAAFPAVSGPAGEEKPRVQTSGVILPASICCVPWPSPEGGGGLMDLGSYGE